MLDGATATVAVTAAAADDDDENVLHYMIQVWCVCVHSFLIRSSNRLQARSRANPVNNFSILDECCVCVCVQTSFAHAKTAKQKKCNPIVVCVRLMVSM